MPAQVLATICTFQQMARTKTFRQSRSMKHKIVHQITFSFGPLLLVLHHGGEIVDYGVDVTIAKSRAGRRISPHRYFHLGASLWSEAARFCEAIAEHHLASNLFSTVSGCIVQR